MKNSIDCRTVAGGVLLALCLGTFACTNQALANAEFQRHYELGKDFLQRQEYKLAIQELDIALAKPATKVELATALVDRGTAYSELKSYVAALEDLDRAIVLDGKSHLAYNNRGVVFLRQGVADKAIENFDRAVALDGEDKYAVVNRAGAYLMTPRSATLAPTTEGWLKNHWQSDFAAQAAVLTVLAYLAGGDKKHADMLDAQALKTLDRLHWPYQMLSFLAGKLAAEKVVEASEDSTYELTQAQCYLGFNAFIKGKPGEDIAKNKFDFVIKHGTTNSVEYWITKYCMTKLAPEKAPNKVSDKVSGKASDKASDRGSDKGKSADSRTPAKIKQSGKAGH